MPSAPPAPTSRAPSPQSIVDDRVARMLRRAVGFRAAIAPVLVLLAALVAGIDGTPWRVAVVTTIATVAVVASLWVERRVRADGLTAASVPANFVGMALAQLSVVTATGGVDSPLLPAVIPLALLTALVLGPRPATFVLVATQVAAILTLTSVQALQLAPFLDLEVLHVVAPGQRLAVGSVVVAILVLGTRVGLGVRSGFETMVADAARAREDQLETWVAWSRDLEALGGEIAHELKNPLASVKGLAALVGRDLQAGRAQERMEVLQAEVERMRGILDEFLTFSRPLTPLTLVEVDPAALGARVVALHEGAGHARGIQLRLAGRARALRADPRKLLQVLVNLVQNALAASRAGGLVEVTVADDGDGVVFEIADRGPGLPPELRDRVFEAGVTSRPDGSGLGLTIALAIVRQHGGTLSLDDRPGGGTLARVWLP